MHETEKWKWSRSVVSDSSRPHRLQPTRLLCPWDFPCNNTGVGCHFLHQGIFSTQGSNLCFLCCRRILYCWATGEALRQGSCFLLHCYIPRPDKILANKKIWTNIYWHVSNCIVEIPIPCNSPAACFHCPLVARTCLRHYFKVTNLGLPLPSHIQI